MHVNVFSLAAVYLVIIRNEDFLRFRSIFALLRTYMCRMTIVIR